MPTIASRSVKPDASREAGHGTSQPTPRRGPARQAFDAPGPPPSPARELARRALDVLRRARLASPPERWLQPGFSREVDLVRLHLGPVRTRAGLAASFGREAFNLAADTERQSRTVPGAAASTRSIGPVHVAYALRWLELGDGRHRPAFPAWLGDPAERSLR
jgi:hypothetical protein